MPGLTLRANPKQADGKAVNVSRKRQSNRSAPKKSSNAGCLKDRVSIKKGHRRERKLSRAKKGSHSASK